MKITILTLFPEYFNSILDSSMIKKAQEKNIVTFKVVNIRDFSTDKHKTTDDRPFGGGPGMVMKVEPIDLALKSIGVGKNSLGSKSETNLPAKQNLNLHSSTDSDIQVKSQSKITSKIILTSAKGKKFNQNIAKDYSNLEDLVIICGHYEGVDERVADNLIDEEIRIGDYVLTGGEPAAAVILDAVTRLIPGTLGNEKSNVGESHDVEGKLGHPSYTRPSDYNGWQVPEVLLGGNHEDIENWRKSKEISE